MSDDHEPATYVVGDVHGHAEPLMAALRENGLLDESGDWAGERTHLWFLGDFVDRGPDGIAAIDLVMRLDRQAAAAGGAVRTLLGNHEILLLGMHHFGGTEVPSDLGTRSFERSWVLNGGQQSDLDGLTD
ncbi:MAG: serine/threonine protein phosphatase, partial [Actinophytocola sp.]|nr:serine/threonine protein phosphatase [Actinophytocola sp.]